MVKYLTQAEAEQIDVELQDINQYGFLNEQLMEMAGMSCSHAVTKVYPNSKNVLVIVGPGNNGGDGLVCARHLCHFGYSISVVSPKKPTKELFIRLLRQCESLEGVKILSQLPSAEEIKASFDVVVDAVFGYNFKGDIRAPFDQVICTLKEVAGKGVPIVSVDVPSGWDIEKGNSSGKSFEPAVLVSLTAPKLCAKQFNGIHLLGGRFVPPALAKKYELNLPAFQGQEIVAKL